MRETPPLPDVDEPMWYAARPACVEARGGPDARALVAACRARWAAPFVVDLQFARVGPGDAAALPVARAIHSKAWRGTRAGDEIALWLRSDVPTLRWGDGGVVPHGGEVSFVASETVVEGLRWPSDREGGAVVLGVARRAEPGEVMDQRRRSGRVFTHVNPVAPAEGAPAWSHDRSLVFHSGFRVWGRLPNFTAAQIAREPVPDMCSPAWLAEHGGPIARAFVEALPKSWHDPAGDAVIVGRINEFSPGWWSCHAGWHFDGTSRIRKRADGCPDLRNPGVFIENIICCVGPTGGTGVLAGEIAVPDIPMGVPRGEVKPHQQRVIHGLLAEGRVAEYQAQPGELVEIGYGDFHACRPSHRPGWRYFIKAMRYRKDEVRNGFAERGQVSWPYEAGAWPDDPLGVFPTELPEGVGAQAG